MDKRHVAIVKKELAELAEAPYKHGKEGWKQKPVSNLTNEAIVIVLRYISGDDTRLAIPFVVAEQYLSNPSARGFKRCEHCKLQLPIDTEAHEKIFYQCPKCGHAV